MEIHDPLQFFQDKDVISENKILPIPIQHETEKEIPSILVTIHCTVLCTCHEIITHSQLIIFKSIRKNVRHAR